MIRVITDKEIPGVMWRCLREGPDGLKYLYILPEEQARAIYKNIGGSYGMQAAAEIN
jgi:hypothetical protein